jgi:moderate conductance mechanosensitive channel
VSLFTPPIAQSAAELERACGEDPGFVCRRALDWTGNETIAETAGWLLDVPLRILLIVVVAWLVNRILRRTIKRGLRRLHSGTLRERLGTVRRKTPQAFLETEETSLRAEQRIEALTSVLRSATTFTIAVITGFLVLGELGVSLGPLLAGAGIIGVALGFGSQSLVKDFLSGLFILVEDQYGVGDIVDLDPETVGRVEAVSLRTTRLRSVDGTVWHVPNGEIRRVGNKSQHWSRALLDVDVAYGTDIGHAQAVIKRVADAAWERDRDVLEEPEVWGVEALGASGVTIRLVVKTTPAEQYRVSRELRAAIKEAFDAEGIEIPFPQQAVWFRQAAAGNGPGAAQPTEKPSSPST